MAKKAAGRNCHDNCPICGQTNFPDSEETCDHYISAGEEKAFFQQYWDLFCDRWELELRLIQRLLQAMPPNEATEKLRGIAGNERGISDPLLHLVGYETGEYQADWVFSRNKALFDSLRAIFRVLEEQNEAVIDGILEDYGEFRAVWTEVGERFEVSLQTGDDVGGAWQRFCSHSSNKTLAKDLILAGPPGSISVSRALMGFFATRGGHHEVQWATAKHFEEECALALKLPDGIKILVSDLRLFLQQLPS